jgi:predicted O-methyltransferase YrrM
MTATTPSARGALRRAVLAALGRRASGPERARMAAIEALRSELKASGEVIERVDFGAGDGTQLSEATHHAGVTVRHTVGEFCAGSSLGPLWSRLLFHLVRELRPAHALELGTALGISAAYQGAALELNGEGRLVTVEGARPLAAIAERNLARLGIRRVEVVTGRFVDVLPAVLDDVRPLDYAYIDGHHDGRATLEYFELVMDAIAGPALLVFDDIGISSGMRAAWAAIRRDRRVSTAIDLRKLGLCEVR